MGSGKKKRTYYTSKEKEKAIEKIIAMAKVVTLEGGGDIKFVPDKTPWEPHE